MSAVRIWRAVRTQNHGVWGGGSTKGTNNRPSRSDRAPTTFLSAGLSVYVGIWVYGGYRDDDGLLLFTESNIAKHMPPLRSASMAGQII